MTQPAKTAKLFRNGRSQAVRLPAEFRFEGTEVSIQRDPVTGNVILSAPASRETGKDLLDATAHLRSQAPKEFEGFMEDRPFHSARRQDFFGHDSAE